MQAFIHSTQEAEAKKSLVHGTISSTARGFTEKLYLAVMVGEARTNALNSLRGSTVFSINGNLKMYMIDI